MGPGFRRGVEPDGIGGLWACDEVGVCVGNAEGEEVGKYGGGGESLIVFVSSTTIRELYSLR